MPETHRPNEQEVIIIEDESLREGFTQIPNALLRRSDVTAGAKVTFMALLSYAWQKDSCFPGQETLAHDIGAGKRSVIRYLQELQEAGLLEIKRRGLGLTNVYVLKKMVGASRSANLALQEVPRPTHPEMPDWHREEYPIKEEESENDYSNIRMPNRSNSDFSNQSSLAHRNIKPLPDVTTEGVIKRKRGRPPKYQDELSRAILSFVSDFSREFADKATLNQSTARIVNDFQSWGKGDMDAFVSILYQARSITKAQRGIRGSRFAYFCSVLENLLGLKDDQHHTSVAN